MSQPETENFSLRFDPSRAGDMLTGVVRAQARMMDAILRQNIETLDFIKRRYEKDRQMLADLSTATDATAMMTAWSSFWSRAMSDYTNEAGTLTSFAAATTEQLIEGLKDEAQAVAGGSSRPKP